MTGAGGSRPGSAASTALRAGPFDDPDRYELMEVRSRGGEGELWRGAVRVDGVAFPVAVKVIHERHLGEIAQWRQRWRQQAEVVRSLDHPALVKVREVFDGPVPHGPGAADPRQPTLYLVMNWVAGATLGEWVSRSPDRDLLDVVRIVAKVAAAVDYLHSGSVAGYPILHRDIKPANVIVNGASATLVDFGFVRLVQSAPVSIAGTPAYLAPELLGGAPYTEAADRYGLGATAFFAITGEPPVTGDNTRNRATLVAAATIGGREELADHVLAMMSLDPARRPTSTLEWAQALAARAV
ncbi:MAG TPA: serine/threonine-protein kinase, partial [Acidimicrobiales bacterium]